MIANNLVQAAIVAYLKSKTSITVKLVDVDGAAHPEEIREDNWQGDTFTYPNIRVDLGNQTNALGPRCSVYNQDFSILVFSEYPTSKECDDIAGAVAAELDGKGFTKNSIRFTGIACTLVPAIRRDERTWRSEVICRATVQNQ